jgi:hypothetical protein
MVLDFAEKSRVYFVECTTVKFRVVELGCGRRRPVAQFRIRGCANARQIEGSTTVSGL